MKSPYTVGLIEIGTNSIKYLVSKKDKDGSVIHLMDQNEVTAIGRGLESSGVLRADRIERSLLSIEKFLRKIKAFNPDEILVVGTMALRKAKNAGYFAKLLKDRAGLGLLVLSGEEESSYSLGSVVKSLGKRSRGWLFDAGGGSSEYGFFDGNTVKNLVSLRLGALTMTDKFFGQGLVSAETLSEALDWAHGVLAGGIGEKITASGVLAGTGGNLVTMASVCRSGEKIPSPGLYPLPAEEISRQVDLYSKTAVSDRSSIPGVPESRASIILAGACIARVSCEFFGAKEILVSTAGLRYGLMEELLSQI